MIERKAFTLVEMLVVVAIIALLALIALGAYGGAKRSAQIDLIADNLVSSIMLQEGLSTAGKIEDGSSSKCYGMSFKTGGGEDSQPEIKYINAPYVAVDNITNQADFCDMTKKNETDFSTDINYELFMLEAYIDGVDKDEVLIMFKPPFGRINMAENNGPLGPPSMGVHPYVNFGISLPNEQNRKYFRFNTATGLAERYYPEVTPANA